MIAILMEYKADATALNKEDKTPCDLVPEKGETYKEKKTPKLI